jgi:hypothetical protein
MVLSGGRGGGTPVGGPLFPLHRNDGHLQVVPRHQERRELHIECIHRLLRVTEDLYSSGRAPADVRLVGVVDRVEDRPLRFTEDLFDWVLGGSSDGVRRGGTSWCHVCYVRVCVSV